MKSRGIGLVIMAYSIALLTGCSDGNSTYFHIQMVDAQTGEGIPMIELKTLHSVSYFSDSQGNIAFHERGFMDRKVYFQIGAPGYQVWPDSAGRPATALFATPGGKATIKLHRTNIASRLYRITGAGIYRDSELLAVKHPGEQTGGVLGQDSNLGAILGDTIFWIWGDSFLPGKYRGNFSVSGATTKGIPDPRRPFPLNYFVDQEGNSRPMIELQGPGYVWFDWIMPSVEGELLAKYARVNNFFLNYERGIARWSPQQQIFERLNVVPEWLGDLHTTQHPEPYLQHGDTMLLLSDEFALSRVRPLTGHLVDAGAYEYLSCQDQDGHILLRGHAPEMQWRANSKGTGPTQFATWIKNGQLSKDQAPLLFRDIETDTIVRVRRGTIRWNQFRRKWIAIFGATNVWYGEADTPVGPWQYVTKIAEHKQFFYNPVHHRFLDQEDGRLIFFQGTLTNFVSKEPPTPRYNYNQLRYQLDLSDDRLLLPQVVYQTTTGPTPVYYLGPDPALDQQATPAFMALDRPVEGTIPIYRTQEGALTSDELDNVLLCWVFPPDHLTASNWEGTWHCAIEFESADNFATLQISIDQNGPVVSLHPEHRGRLTGFENPVLENDQLILTLPHEAKTYQLTARLNGNEFGGTWHCRETGYRGKWSGKRWGFRNTLAGHPQLQKLWLRPDGQVEIGSKPNSSTARAIGQAWKAPNAWLADFDMQPLE